MKRTRKEESSQDAAIDMTPIIDIVFILLIFFVLSAQFEKPQAVAVDRPASATTDKTTNDALILSIDKSGTIFWRNDPITLNEITPKMKAYWAGRQGQVILNADKEITTGKLVEVVDAIRLGGVQNVAVATKEQ